jgi:transcriptional regulator with XRE-family HTH domain
MFRSSSKTRLFLVEDLKQNLAGNITALRQASSMTQLELAEKLNYSDKAVSKWERGESIPDVTVLKSIADLFGVSLDYLLEAEHNEKPKPSQESPGYLHRNRKVATTLSVLLVWFIATVAYVLMDILIPAQLVKWLPFAYSVPTSMIVWLVFNSIWFNKRRNYFIISLLMWTGLACIVLTVAAFGASVWKLLLLGIPGQIAVLLWSLFQRRNRNA